MTFWNELQGAEFCQRYIDCAGVRTRIVETGAGARALILLHGVQGHLEVWLRNVAAFGARHRVVAFDLLGHGFTGKPDRPYEIRDYLEHALVLLDTLGIKRATWIGSSLGGWISARAAAQFPERVEKLVLVSTAGLSADPAVMATPRSGAARSRRGRAPRTRLERASSSPFQARRARSRWSAMLSLSRMGCASGSSS